jgi:zinc finger protein 830
MTDVRSLLRNERVSRRINHAHAHYSDSGKLSCAVCNLHIKTESLWENHIVSPQHTARLEHVRANPPAQSRKRKAGQGDDDDRKRLKAQEDAAPPSSLPHASLDPPTPAPPPVVDEDEWAAFERDMIQTAPPVIHASATISAAPVSADDLAAQAREEQIARRSARDAEIEADTEEATLALEQEFDQMEELDERVRRLREKREALRIDRQSDTLPDAPPPVVSPHLPEEDGDDDDDDDDDDDEFDDWTFGAR